MASQDELETVQGPSEDLGSTLAGDSGPGSLESSGVRRGESVGRYVVLDRLGAGGMGVVMVAYDPELNRKVALKLLRGAVGSRNSSSNARLMREAQSLARLVHPNVVSVFDVGMFGDSVFVAMEYVEGTTLGDRMETWRAEPPPWSEVVRVFLEAGRGLAAAHDVGIVHRDFKPANTMVARDGRVLVLDFGLAQESGQETASHGGRGRSSISDARLTQTGAILGTPAYMSPEQLRRERVDAASDQFSFCVALYEGLHGKRPFEGDSLATLTDSVLSGKIERTQAREDVPAHVQDAVLKGLRPKPEERFASMRDLLDALQPAPAIGLAPWLWVGTGVVVAAGVMGTLWWVTQRAADECRGVTEAAFATWNPEKATQLAERFEAVQGAFGAEVAPLVVGKLDTYTQRWTSGRRGICEAEATDSGGELVRLSQALCYERSLSALDGWVTLALDADAAVVFRAAESVSRLPDLTECASTEIEPHRAEMLEDPVQRAQWQRIEGELERALAKAELGEMEVVGPTLQGALAAAEELGAPALESRAWRQLSRLIVNTGGDSEEALVAARNAVLRAEVSADDDQLIAGLRNLTFLVAMHAGQFDEAKAVLARLDAIIARNGDRPVLRKASAVLHGKISQRARDWDAAMTAYEEALAIQDEHALPFDPDDIGLYNGLAQTRAKLHRYDEAEHAARRALELGAEHLGQGHPSNALTEFSFARIEEGRGDEASALAAYRRAEAIFQARYPQGHRNLPGIRNEIGRKLRALGRTDEAIQVLEAGLESMQAVAGPDDLDVSSFHTNLGLVKADQGSFDAALEHLRASLRISRSSLGESSESAFYGAMNLGEVLVAAGRLEEAASVYEEADRWRLEHAGTDDPLRAEVFKGRGEIAYAQGSLETADEQLSRAVELTSPEVESFVRGQTYFSLAKVRWDLGRKEEARELAAKAITHWEDGPRAEQTGVTEARAWLANRPKD